MRPKNGWIATTLFAFALTACGGADTENNMAEDAAEAPSADAADPTMAPPGDATAMPAGFELRLDRPTETAADFHVMPMGSMMHIQTGPAGIFYNATENTVESGNYTVSASFTEVGAPVGHREAYGIFIGGSDLQGEGQVYTYFLVRADGSYLIKKRAGAETSAVTEDWIKSDAVHAATAEATDITNALQIRVEGETAHFSINGTEVTTVPVTELDAYGVAGARVNHNLNVQVADWTLTRG